MVRWSPGRRHPFSPALPRQDLSRSHRGTEMHENDIGTLIADSAIHLHQDLGPELLETVYGVTSAAKLRKRGLAVTHQAPLAIGYEGQQFDERRHRPMRSSSPMKSSPCLHASVRTPRNSENKKNVPKGNRPTGSNGLFFPAILQQGLSRSHRGTEMREWKRRGDCR